MNNFNRDTLCLCRYNCICVRETELNISCCNVLYDIGCCCIIEFNIQSLFRKISVLLRKV